MAQIEEKNEFEQYQQEVITSIGAVQERIGKEKSERTYVDYKLYVVQKLKSEIDGMIGQAFGLEGYCGNELSFPPAHVSGDFAFEVFSLAKQIGEAPVESAKKVAAEINQKKDGLVKGATLAGAFVNLEIDKPEIYKDVIGQIISMDECYGESDPDAGKVALFDYSAPNIAKPIGVGHLRSTIIGQALLNIYHETGFCVIGDNHLGDWGTQFGKLIYAYQHWGDEEKILKNPIGELKDLYVRFTKESADRPELKDEARELFLRLEQGDPKLMAIWKRFRDLSLIDFGRVYQKLGISFDTYIGESFFTKEADGVVDECLEKKLCRIDGETGAVVVDEIGDLPSFLLRKKDGTSLYLTRDLATLIFRIKTFKPDVILYIVGNEQDLNFKQMFAFAKSAGYVAQKAELKHIGFGMVLRDGKKMSTRQGTLIELDELIDQSIAKAREILVQKNPAAADEELDKVAEIVGMGAIIYNDLRQARTKNISFDWKRMLDLEGGSAVYLQYSYVRVKSILRKLAETFGEIDFESMREADFIFENKSEFELAKKLMLFPEIILKARDTDAPHHVCVYLEEVALAFNSFYNETSLLKTGDKKLRDSRVALCKSVSIVIKKGLKLLSIRVPERM